LLLTITGERSLFYPNNEHLILKVKKKKQLTFPLLMASLAILTTLLTLDAIHRYLKNLCNKSQRIPTQD